MSMEPPYSVADQWRGYWNPVEFKRWALQLRRRFLPREVTLGLVFVAEELADEIDEIVDVLRNSIGIPVLAGCVASGVIADEFEHERNGGVALGLYSFPGGQVVDFAFPASMASDAGRDGEPGFWRRRFEPGSESIGGWLVFAEPLHVDVEAFLESWRRDFPGRPVYGGLAQFDASRRRSAIIWNDSVFADGGVALGFSGGVRIRGLTAQGCVPVGEAWTITRASENVLERIGNRPAYRILDETYHEMSEELRERSGGRLFAGLAVDEYRSDFSCGDFVVRNLLAADPEAGTVTIGARPRAGQTLQFQIRDAVAASDELKSLALQLGRELRGQRMFGACLASCAGRGWGMFGVPHHDASIAARLVFPQAVCGFIGNGEFGSVGERSFAHAYAASLAVFCGNA